MRGFVLYQSDVFVGILQSQSDLMLDHIGQAPCRPRDRRTMMVSAPKSHLACQLAPGRARQHTQLTIGSEDHYPHKEELANGSSDC